MLKTPFKKKPVTLKRLKNWILSLVGLTIILIAISFTLVRVAIKSIPDYSAAIQKAVSEQIDMTLEVGLIDAEIYWLIPRLNLFDVNLSDKSGKHHLLHLEEIDLSLDWSNSLRTMTPVIGEVTLVGLDVELGINNKSQLMIQNYVIKKDIESALQNAGKSEPVKKVEISDAIKYNINNVDFRILNSRLRLYDERYKKRSKILKNLNLHLLNGGDEHVFEMKFDLPEMYGKNVHFIIEIEGDLFDYNNLIGETYLSVNDISAAPWLDDYWESLGIAANANINAQAWVKWNKREITGVTSKVNLSEVAVHYLNSKVNTWEIDQLDADFQWQKDSHGWQLDVRNLMSVRQGQAWPKPAAAMLKMTNGLIENDYSEIQIYADFLRIEGLVYLTGMVNSFFDDDVFPWVATLQKHQPTGDLKQLDISLPLGMPDKIKLNTQFSRLGFSVPDAEPKLISNLKGAIGFSDNKTWVSLDSADVIVDFNKLFRNAINLTELNGMLEISHLDNVWRLNTSYLQMNTPHITTKNRVNFSMPDDGRPFLDLTTLFENGNGEFVNLYLPAGVMGNKVVPWLDKGITKGHIHQGGYQFYGYLGDAPFRKHQGISLVDFTASNVELNYLEGWPVITDINAHLRFENDSMNIVASKGFIFNSEIRQANVYIDNFVSPTLDVKGSVDTRLKNLKTFVNSSTLKNKVSDYINNLEFNGKGDLDLELFLPLYGDFHTEMGGQLIIKDGGLLFKKENYQLSGINGAIRFAGKTVESSDLNANIADKPVNIEIKTSRDFGDESYYINLVGNFPAASLLAPVPEMVKHFKGSTDWDISLDINPSKQDKKTSIDINVLSSLKGVTSDLPGPLGKIKTDKRPMKLDIDVSPGSHINYELNLDTGMKVTLNDLKDQWLISADTKCVKGKVRIAKSKEIDSPVKIDLEYLDLNKFLHLDELDGSDNEILSGSVSNVDILPGEIPSLEFSTKKLTWKKFKFNKSSFSTQQSKQGMAVKSFQLNANDFSLIGKGSWFYGWNKLHTTELETDIKIINLGNIFNEFDSTSKLMGASGDSTLRWQWKDMPHKFSWNKLEGDGSLRLKDGTLGQLDAGAGRLLGLLNFKTLLSLDFGNQMSEGFTFDKVHGSFSFANGNIYSDDFTVESKVADVYMKGRLGLDDEVIDQKITVHPHLGATVTLGTTVVAGPAAGGIVYLFQKIFNTDSLSEYQYSMKGDIDNPEVKLLSAPTKKAEEEVDNEF